MSLSSEIETLRGPKRMDLTGQLSNLPESVRSLFNLPLERHPGQPCAGLEPRHRGLLTPRFVAIRATIIDVLSEEGDELRLMELHRRVEGRFGEAITRARFKDYVNDQSRGENAILERLGYGRYRLVRR
jgi:hypothetical protein